MIPDVNYFDAVYEDVITHSDYVHLRDHRYAAEPDGPQAQECWLCYYTSVRLDYSKEFCDYYKPPAADSVADMYQVVTYGDILTTVDQS